MLKIKTFIAGLIGYFWRNPLVLAFLMSLSLLAGAYAFQYIGGLEPCHLCWWQRYAHMAILVTAASGLLLKNAGWFWRKLWPWATAVALDVSVVAAGYHTGVEQKWWPGPATCTSSGLTQVSDLNSLFDTMMNAKLVMCDKIPWEMFGISMAGYNFLISLATAVFVAFALFAALRKRHAG
ncbi:MAG: disulfide bond formation protein B [Alphaproteobacteria bacterium]|nr:disulfide bond formation protein B [Alphaproteobacteria bacterium]